MDKKEIYNALSRFNDEYIPFPPFMEAVKRIEDSLAFYRETGIAQHLLVLGNSGTGKSTLCKWVEQKYPRFTAPDRDVLPVLYITVAPTTTIRSMVEQMLERLGDPYSSSGNAASKTDRFILLCKACRVEMIMFDEAQHLQDRGQNTTHYMVADWLKSLVDQIGIPTVFLGLPRLVNLLQVNEQLRRRFSQRIYLALGQSDSESIHSECLQLFISLGTCLPVPLSCGDLGWEELGVRLFYATDGRVSYIKKLLASALRYCLEQEFSEIGPEQLEHSFTGEIWWNGVGKLNPFNSSFEFRPLDRGDEPFEHAIANRSKARR